MLQQTSGGARLASRVVPCICLFLEVPRHGVCIPGVSPHCSLLSFVFLSLLPSLNNKTQRFFRTNSQQITYYENREQATLQFVVGGALCIFIFYLFIGSLAREIRYIEIRRIHVYIPLPRRNYPLGPNSLNSLNIRTTAEFIQQRTGKFVLTPIKN